MKKIYIILLLCFAFIQFSLAQRQSETMSLIGAENDTRRAAWSVKSGLIVTTCNNLNWYSQFAFREMLYLSKWDVKEGLFRNDLDPIVAMSKVLNTSEII